MIKIQMKITTRNNNKKNIDVFNKGESRRVNFNGENTPSRQIMTSTTSSH